MSGGLPRDLIRVARDLVALSQKAGQPENLTEISSALAAGDVRRKIVAARLAAQNTGLDTAVADFVTRLPPDGVAADGMCEVGTRLFDALAEVPSATDTDRQHSAEFRRIVAETATYLYFSSTVQEFFERFSQASRTDAAAVAKVARDADDLAACRRAFTAGPRLARWRSRRWRAMPDRYSRICMCDQPTALSALAC